MFTQDIIDEELAKIAAEEEKRKPAALSEEELNAAFDKELDAMFNEEMANQAEAAGQKHVVDEEHESFTTLSGKVMRLFANNFGNNNKQKLNYLKDNFPDLEFGEEEGNIIARDKEGSRVWKKFDSDKVDYMDVLDEIVPIVSGYAETVGSGVGGVTGGALGLASPIPGGTVMGALGGSALGGAATSTVLEGVKQLIAKAGGLETDEQKETGDIFDTARLGEQALWGGVSGPLFSSGATKKMIEKMGKSSPFIQKQLHKAKDLFNQTGKGAKSGGHGLAAIERAQQGLVGRGFDQGKKIASPLMGFLSANPPSIIRHGIDNIDKVREAEVDPTVLPRMVEEYSEVMINSAKRDLDEVGSAVSEVISRSGDDVQVSLVDVMEPFNKLIDDLSESAEKLGPDEEEALALMKQLKHNLFSNDKARYADEVIEFSDQKVLKVPGELSGELQQLPVKYAAIFKRRLNDITGIRKQTKAVDQGAIDTSMGKMDSYSKDVKAAAREAVKRLEIGIENALPDTPKYKALKEKYKKSLKMRNNVNDHFSTPEKTEKNLTNIFSGTAAKKQRLLDTSEYYGADAREQAKDIITIGSFTDAVSEGFSLKDVMRKTPGTYLGLGLGSYAGSQVETENGGDIRMLGGILGAGIGTALTGKGMLRNYIGGSAKALSGWKALKENAFVPVDYNMLPATPQTGINIGRELNRRED